MRNKRMAAAGLAVIMVIGGTWAYFNQKMTIVNPFSTGKYDSVLIEDFTPDNNWQPGAKIDKVVAVENTGDYDLLVRVKFEEKWVNSENPDWSKTNTKADVFATQQDNPSDGLITNDKSVVKKTLDEAKWVYNEEDGYWYYKENLKSNNSTGAFLKDVTLLEDVDMGKYDVKNYYTRAETAPEKTAIGISSAEADVKWILYNGEMPDGSKHNMAVTELNPDAPGYANANYTLTITAETVQATSAAMQSSWGLTAAPSECTWEFKEQN